MYEGRGSAPTVDGLAPDVWTGTGRRMERLPGGFDQIAAGPGLATAVSAIDPVRLQGRDLVPLLMAAQRVISHYQALRYRVISHLAEVLDDDHQLTAAEVATALHLTRVASETETLLASGLQTHPQIARALSWGEIDVRRAKVLIDATVGLDVNTADAVVARGLAEAAHLTTGQLRAQLVKHRLTADPEEAKARYQAAIENRRVVVTANPDGTANLHAFNLPPDQVMAARRRINQLARQARAPGDDRTADQRRADTFVDLLATSTGGTAQSSLTVLIPAETLLGGDTPADVPGFGPILADIARQITRERIGGQWEYIVTDNGRPVATGTFSRRATEAMRRHLRAAQPTCVFPGCRMPAQDSDLDHRQPWAKHHKTKLKDLAPLCRYHHQTRHKGWTYQPTPQGDIVWTSPLGHTYTTSGTDPP